jgi:predicted AAA+ superfamily ATPase
MRAPRYLENAVAKALKTKMAFVGGPRQVGKTTFALGFLGGKQMKPIRHT